MDNDLLRFKIRTFRKVSFLQQYSKMTGESFKTSMSLKFPDKKF